MNHVRSRFLAPATALLAFALLAVLPAAALAMPQIEAPHPAPHPAEAPRPGEHATDRDHPEDEATGAHEFGTFKLAPGERLRVPREEEAFDRAMAQQPVTIYWKKTIGADHRIKYDAYREDPGAPPPGTWVDASTLTRIQSSGLPVVHTGEIPTGPTWQAFTSSHSNVAVQLRGSQNSSPEALKLAGALGVTTLATGHTRIFNALPQATDPAASQRERSRMGLQRTGTVADWKAVNEGIREKTEGLKVEVARRSEILEELEHGSSDVVIIYAHFDGRMLHLPGESGSLADNTISVAELAKMNRVGDPAVKERIIVLAACSTASPVEGQSLAQVLLKTGIARTVFATDRPYDAREIPGLMTRLRSQPVRDAGGQLRQYVELQLPFLFILQGTHAHE